MSIEIHTASYRSIRGYTVIGAVCDEMAFWNVEDSANPDTEILTALRPAMATVPRSMLIVLSSVYSRRGEVWRTFRESYGQERDDVLVVRGATRTLNPNVPQAVIDAAYAADPVAAAAEWGAEFRRDIDGFVTQEAIDAATVRGRLELPPLTGTRYVAFVDPAGGSGTDSMTLGVAHVETQDGLVVAVVDALREARPPFSPDAVVSDFTTTLRQFRVNRVTGDRYAGEWPRERFRRHGVLYVPSRQNKSDLYREVLPLLNSGRVELLDDPTLRSQLFHLERKTTSTGRDVIDHPPGTGAASHDDRANAAAGALVLAIQADRCRRPSLKEAKAFADFNTSLFSPKPSHEGFDEFRAWADAQGE